nr:hypothetical protein [Candidatus Gracilibacteria bacterium]
MANGNVIDFRNSSGYKGDLIKQHFNISDLIDSTSSQVALALIKRQGMENIVLKYIHVSYPGLKDIVKSLNDIRIVSYEPDRFQLLFEINGILKHVILTNTEKFLSESKRREKLGYFLGNNGTNILSHFDELTWFDLWKIDDFSIRDSIIYFSLYGYDFACYNGHNREIIELLLSQGVRLPKNVIEEQKIEAEKNMEIDYLKEKERCISIIETWFPNINLDNITDIAFPNRDNEMIYFSYLGTLYSVLGYPKHEVDEDFYGVTPYPHLYRIK